jgi:CRP-like cAMP-binding protein
MNAALIEPLLRKLKSIGDLTAEQEAALSSLPLRAKRFEAREDVVRDGDRPHECGLLVEGFLYRYKTLPDGGRQILAFHTPGDVPDLQSLHLRTMDHGLAAVSTSTVAFIPHEDVRQVLREHPTLTDLLWRDTLIDAAIFRQWMAAMGRRSARGHMAHLLCEVFLRLSAVGLSKDQSVAFPMTQTQLADALGISSVHINRILQELRTEKMIALQGGRLAILSWQALSQEAQFDPTYLHLRTAPPSVG